MTAQDWIDAINLSFVPPASSGFSPTNILEDSKFYIFSRELDRASGRKRESWEGGLRNKGYSFDEIEKMIQEGELKASSTVTFTLPDGTTYPGRINLGHLKPFKPSLSLKPNDPHYYDDAKGDIAIRHGGGQPDEVLDMEEFHTAMQSGKYPKGVNAYILPHNGSRPEMEDAEGNPLTLGNLDAFKSYEGRYGKANVDERENAEEIAARAFEGIKKDDRKRRWKEVGGTLLSSLLNAAGTAGAVNLGGDRKPHEMFSSMADLVHRRSTRDPKVEMVYKAFGDLTRYYNERLNNATEAGERSKLAELIESLNVSNRTMAREVAQGLYDPTPDMMKSIIERQLNSARKKGVI